VDWVFGRGAQRNRSFMGPLPCSPRGICFQARNSYSSDDRLSTSTGGLAGAKRLGVSQRGGEEYRGATMGEIKWPAGWLVVAAGSVIYLGPDLRPLGVLGGIKRSSNRTRSVPRPLLSHQYVWGAFGRLRQFNQKTSQGAGIKNQALNNKRCTTDSCNHKSQSLPRGWKKRKS